ncbi:hypothetical protein BO71DRAFT_450984 [Aspergillus ellipticus CBS 707.79]|uniref:NAD(P)-binding protein n=1 Tax=Aspergillus ellipticus CBS 707.79 TaxID=1448320 RepID=A0A319DFR6_9EURO|nr:hypothetical protein BO71DRAFT_450984 [Aspergillus ellipticus CBS 707.79]
MTHNILLTGASGYLGGTVLARWKDAHLPPYSAFYALVRSAEQGETVKKYGAEPRIININDHDSITRTIIEKEITMVYFLIDAYTATHQPALIKALGEVKKKTGKEVHFLNTTGPKQSSRHGGILIDHPFSDTDPHLYEMQKDAKSLHDFVGESVNANVTVIDAAEANGVRSYIFAPCLVYGKGEGFGNLTSIQDVDIVRAATKLRQVFKVDNDDPIWPVCHVADTVELYLHILRKILCGEDIGYGKNGFFLATSGSVHWNKIYGAMANSLAKRGLVDDETVRQATGTDQTKMAESLSVPSAAVPVLMGGRCFFTAEHGRKIGWKPHYPPEHILEAADDEVAFILKGLGSGKKRPDVR